MHALGQRRNGHIQQGEGDRGITMSHGEAHMPKAATSCSCPSAPCSCGVVSGAVLVGSRGSTASCAWLRDEHCDMM